MSYMFPRVKDVVITLAFCARFLWYRSRFCVSVKQWMSPYNTNRDPKGCIEHGMKNLHWLCRKSLSLQVWTLCDNYISGWFNFTEGQSQNPLYYMFFLRNVELSRAVGHWRKSYGYHLRQVANWVLFDRIWTRRLGPVSGFKRCTGRGGFSKPIMFILSHNVAYCWWKKSG